jgi:hypothetical protein
MYDYLRRKPIVEVSANEPERIAHTPETQEEIIVANQEIENTLLIQEADPAIAIEKEEETIETFPIDTSEVVSFFRTTYIL